MERLLLDVTHKWKPFTVEGEHLTFKQHVRARLSADVCSHWGAAVYKWQGPIHEGPHAGKTGMLIGETGDLRQRIKQYVAGTQDRGNKLWRETFLLLGDVRLYTLDLISFTLGTGENQSEALTRSTLGRPNLRLVLEQLLLMRALSSADETVWVVNARQ